MSPLKGVKKGSSFEQKVADYLGTERRHLRGVLDRGDLVLKRWVAEIKCPGRGRPLDLSAAMNESKKQAANAGLERYCVITRRTGYPVEEAFFTVPLSRAVEEGWIE